MLLLQEKIWLHHFKLAHSKPFSLSKVLFLPKGTMQQRYTQSSPYNVFNLYRHNQNQLKVTALFDIPMTEICQYTIIANIVLTNVITLNWVNGICFCIRKLGTLSWSTRSKYISFPIWAVKSSSLATYTKKQICKVTKWRTQRCLS
jgi:hypothetical protein